MYFYCAHDVPLVRDWECALWRCVLRVCEEWGWTDYYFVFRWCNIKYRLSLSHCTSSIILMLFWCISLFCVCLMEIKINRNSFTHKAFLNPNRAYCHKYTTPISAYTRGDKTQWRHAINPHNHMPTRAIPSLILSGLHLWDM